MAPPDSGPERAAAGRSAAAPVPFVDPIDPSLEFLYKPHSVSALVIAFALLVYYAFSGPAMVTGSPAMGLVAALCVFLFFCALNLRDGPFIRPHPVFWRVVMGATLAYQLGLTFLLFQDADWARNQLHKLDGRIGLPLPERSYAENCSVEPSNLIKQLDEFVVAHVLGWTFKAIILRDYWLCWVLSVMFELCEYSLEHQLPNFAECWWDHWILDVLLCNLVGMVMGMRICRYFEMKEYAWTGFTKIPTLKGKMRRLLGQFTPHSWAKFNWQFTSSFLNYFVIIALIALWLVCELNAFYLKYILYVPPSHYLNIVRLGLFFFGGVAAVREVYQFVTDPASRRLGNQANLIIALIVTEVLVCFKFGQGMFGAPFPTSVVAFWTVLGSLTLVVYPLWRFGPWSRQHAGSLANEPPAKPLIRAAAKGAPGTRRKK